MEPESNTSQSSERHVHYHCATSTPQFENLSPHLSYDHKAGIYTNTNAPRGASFPFKQVKANKPTRAIPRPNEVQTRIIRAQEDPRKVCLYVTKTMGVNINTERNTVATFLSERHANQRTRRERNQVKVDYEMTECTKL